MLYLCSSASSAAKALTLGELEAFAGALLPVLLTLVLARVTRQQTQFLQLAAQLDIEIQQRARDAQLGRSGLTGGPAAIGGDQNIELVGCFGGEQRLAHDCARRFARKIMFEGAAVDGDLAFAGPQKHTRHRGLAAARSQMLY